MNSNFFRIFLLLIAAFSLKPAHAQGPPIYTGTPILLGLDGGGLRTFGRYISKENGTAYVQPFAVPYNLTTKFQIGGIVPFVSKSPEGLERKSGIGDVRFLPNICSGRKTVRARHSGCWRASKKHFQPAISMAHLHSVQTLFKPKSDWLQDM